MPLSPGWAASEVGFSVTQPAAANSPTVADVRCPDTPGWRLFVPVRPAPASRLLAAPEESGVSAVIIKRGDPVVLRASLGGGTEVRMGGRALGQARSHTAGIAHFLRHPKFPVDIRHNAKIGREKLAAWVQQQGLPA